MTFVTRFAVAKKWKVYCGKENIEEKEHGYITRTVEKEIVLPTSNTAKHTTASDLESIEFREIDTQLVMSLVSRSHSNENEKKKKSCRWPDRTEGRGPYGSVCTRPPLVRTKGQKPNDMALLSGNLKWPQWLITSYVIHCVSLLPSPLLSCVGGRFSTVSCDAVLLFGRFLLFAQIRVYPIRRNIANCQIDSPPNVRLAANTVFKFRNYFI